MAFIKQRRLEIFRNSSRIDLMAEHIEDLQQRFAELNKRIELVRSFL